MSSLRRLESYLDIDSGFRIIDGQEGRVHSALELRQVVEVYRQFLSELPRDVLILRFTPSVEAVAFYFAALLEQRPLILVDPISDSLLASLIVAYRPVAIFSPNGVPSLDSEPFVLNQTLTNLWVALDSDRRESLNGKTALLLTTSGSTGSPKLVRLTLDNVLANAESIAASLKIGESDVAITSMPLFYSYGLSVLNSHLAAGATVVLSSSSILEPGFWEVVQKFSVTSFSGVPYTYQMLARLGGPLLEKASSLNKLTQAGGKLPVALVRHFDDWSKANLKRFYVMYGQTEACARMSCLDPDFLPSRLGSVGRSIPSGTFFIENADITTGVGEITYKGPNVMLGYASSKLDLIADVDELSGVLRTGDLGYLDSEGFLFITGRSKRIAKVAGVRISLEEVEALVTGVVCCAAQTKDDRIVLYVEGPTSSLDEIKSCVVRRLEMHPSFLQVIALDALPRTPNGKIDYKSLV